MAYMYCHGSCAACGRMLSFNPDKVPSIRVNGERQPLCPSCVAEWSRIHGQPVSINPDAYEPLEVA